MQWKFGEFNEYSESDKINGEYYGVNLKILSVARDLLHG